MKKTWLLIAALTLLALTVVVGVTFPASLAWRWWGAQAPDVRLIGVSGTVWNGAASRVIVRGHTLGRLEWQLSPWRLLRGQPQAQLAIVGTGLKLSGEVSRHGEREVQIDRFAADAEADWLAPVLAIPALEPTGRLVAEGARLVMSANGMPREVDARIEWREAGVRGQVVARLGTLVIEAHGRDGRIDASVSDRGDGEVEVSGSAHLDQGQYRSETALIARSQSGPVVEALQWIGAPRSEGGRLLIVEGRLDLPGEQL